MREEQEACDACYNRLIKHYPEDANILYGGFLKRGCARTMMLVMI